MNIVEIGKFLHIVDDDGRLDLTDIAFMIIMGKIMFAATLDWTAVVTLATVILNKMQKRSSIATTADFAQVQEQAKQLQDIKEKIEPIIEKVKGIIP